MNKEEETHYAWSRAPLTKLGIGHFMRGLWQESSRGSEEKKPSVNVLDLGSSTPILAQILRYRVFKWNRAVVRIEVNNFLTGLTQSLAGCRESISSGSEIHQPDEDKPNPFAELITRQFAQRQNSHEFSDQLKDFYLTHLESADSEFRRILIRAAQKQSLKGEKREVFERKLKDKEGFIFKALSELLDENSAEQFIDLLEAHVSEIATEVVPRKFGKVNVYTLDLAYIEGIRTSMQQVAEHEALPPELSKNFPLERILKAEDHIQANAERLPFESSSLSAIFAIESVPYWTQPESFKQILIAGLSVLKKEGEFVIFPYDVCEQSEREDKRGELEEILEALEKNKFEVSRKTFTIEKLMESLSEEELQFVHPRSPILHEEEGANLQLVVIKNTGQLENLQNELLG